MITPTINLAQISRNLGVSSKYFLICLGQMKYGGFIKKHHHLNHYIASVALDEIKSLDEGQKI